MITVVVAVDDKHLTELQKTLPTWIKYKQFNKYPFLVIYDADQLSLSDPRFSIFSALNVEYVPFSDPVKTYNTQREKMLTALTVIPGDYVKTEWYLKIDTDCIATDDSKWFDESWLKKDYVFITNKWGSTKPANAIELLDQWMVTKKHDVKPLNLPYNKDDIKIKHERIISWVFLCKTSWSKEMNAYFYYHGIYQLPSISSTEYKVSQDTVLWYLATVLNYKYKLFKFKSKGWLHTKIH